MSPVAARPVAPLGGEGARVTLAPMGDAFVALPLAGDPVSRAGFLPAGGLAGADRPGRQAPRTAGQHARWRPIGPPRPTLVVAGLRSGHAAARRPRSACSIRRWPSSWWPCPSQEALRLAADGLVHVAGAHLRGRSGDYNTGPAGELLPAGRRGDRILLLAGRAGAAP